MTLEDDVPHRYPEETAAHGRLWARPRAGGVRGSGAAGRSRVGSSHLYVPDAPLRRLVVLFHGAGGNAEQALDLLLPHADAHGLALLAPKSVAGSWDVIAGGYGPDVSRLDEALEEVFATYDVAPGEVAVGGFSDGASYALSLGIANGDLFDAIVAFAPGFTAPLVVHGRPRVLVTHGTRDAVLPVDRCGRRVVGQLRAAGYDVTYEEFDGPHTVPENLRELAARWLTSGSSS